MCVHESVHVSVCVCVSVHETVQMSVCECS